MLLSGAAAAAAGARVLDACAAPGGKTAHLLELAELDLLALDSDPLRLARVQDTLNRLQLQRRAEGRRRAPARPTGGTAGPSTPSCSTRPAPPRASCAATPTCAGCAAPTTSTALARIQAELLDALWPLLAPGGRLLYATCSIFKAEGQAQIDAFLQRCGAGAAALAPQSPGPPAAQPRQCSAGEPGPPRRRSHDGFFYALIRKT